MDKREELRARTKQTAIRIVRLYKSLPRTTEAQAFRSGTAVGANYRAACMARSRAEFISRIGVVAEEANETIFWLELLVDTGIIPAPKLQPLITEFTELVKIFAATWRTAKAVPIRDAAARQ